MRRGGLDPALAIAGIVAVVLAAGGVIAYTATRSDELPTYGPSMRPTLTGNGPVEIDTDAYDSAPPQLGDIVILQGPDGLVRSFCAAEHSPRSPCPVAGDGYDEIRLLKRVVGGPGDTIAFGPDGGLIRNGDPVDEPYIQHCFGDCALPDAIEVPAGHFFVAGDNRPNSSDSRVWGSVPAEAIDAKVLLDE